ncbi:MAG: hypothetical protein AB7G54_08750 [Methyloceanibacter sp.]
MQTYVAEIDGRAIFAFRAVDDANAQAWLDVHAVMRHALETLQSNGRRIWNGQAPIRARKARPHEATIWSNLSGEVAVADPREEIDSIMVWLIPTSNGRHVGDAR